jgi:hypothetical protein
MKFWTPFNEYDWENVFLLPPSANFFLEKIAQFKNLTLGLRRFRYATVRTPYAFNFDKRISWSTVSKAFLSSKNTKALTLPQSIMYAQSLVVSRWAVTVEWSWWLRKPDWFLKSSLFLWLKTLIWSYTLFSRKLLQQLEWLRWAVIIYTISFTCLNNGITFEHSTLRENYQY